MPIWCQQHAGQPAGWTCHSCEAALCPACTAERQAGTHRVPVCAVCGGLAEPIRERRALLKPFQAALPEALLWPFTGRGPLLLLLLGVAVGLTALFHSSLLGYATVLAYLFSVVRWTALGNDDVPGAADFRGLFEDLIAPLTRTFLASVWVIAPPIVLSWGFSRPLPLPVIVLVTIAGALILPVSLIASAVETPLGQILNPLVLGAYAWRLGRDYLALIGFWVLSALVQAALLGLGGSLAEGSHALSFLLSVASLAMPLAFFRALGLLLRARGDDLGYGRAADYLLPVLGEVQPAAGLRENLPGHERPRRAATSGELAPAIPLDLDAQPESAPQELVTRLRAGDASGALDLLVKNAGAIDPRTLSAEGWLQLGQAGAREKRWKPALAALKRALQVAPEGPTAPQAWLLAARLYDEGLQDRAESDRLLGELLKRFPQSAEAAFAARRLPVSE